MAISKEIYKALEAAVGPEYISDDPVICEGYRSGPGGYENGLGYERVMTKVPGCVIMPRTTEEVQRIVKICSISRSRLRLQPTSQAPHSVQAYMTSRAFSFQSSNPSAIACPMRIFPYAP